MKRTPALPTEFSAKLHKGETPLRSSGSVEAETQAEEGFPCPLKHVN
jgi:hypothetical protein